MNNREENVTVADSEDKKTTQESENNEILAKLYANWRYNRFRRFEFPARGLQE